MGAWGVGHFDNDDAMDWLGEISDNPKSSLIEATLTKVAEFEKKGFFGRITSALSQSKASLIEAPDCTTALAAAEVVAALRGRAAKKIPDLLNNLIKSNSIKLGENWAALAEKAVSRIGANSELKDLWDESDDSTAWYDELNDLKQRLR